MSKDSITVILNGYRRNYTLKEQVESVVAQTKPVDKILYWQNSTQNQTYDLSPLTEVQSDIAISNVNYGVWARFAHALNAKTEYVCIIDDDTFPGDMWMENCLETYKTHPGLLGTIGIKFGQGGGYHVPSKECRPGWDFPNEKVVQADIVGHSWFFHRDMLSIFWRELPPIEQPMMVGEDIHFSYMLQKYTDDCAAWVPPHPVNSKRMWGSTNALKYGGDSNSTAIIGNNGGYCVPLMAEYLNKCIKNGFELLSDPNTNARRTPKSGELS